MSRVTLAFLLAGLLFGPVGAEPSTVLAQTRPVQTASVPLRSVDQVLGSLVTVTPIRASSVTGLSSLGWSPALPPLASPVNAGTGFVVGIGEVLTSARLVQGNDTVRVRTRDGRTLTAQVVSTRPDQDLALLRVTKASALLLGPPVTLGNSDQLVTGERLIALGLTPDGGFTAQEVAVRDVGAGGPELTLGTALNPAARGGPLVNAAGEVVALNTGRFGARVALPFLTGTSSAALPINAAKAILSELQAGQGQTPLNQTLGTSPDHPRLGVQIVDLSEFTAAQLRPLNLPNEGLLVQQVLPGSPAARANLSTGSIEKRVGHAVLRVDADVIVAVNGQRVRTPVELQRAVGAAGATAELELVRNGQTRRVPVQLEPSGGRRT
ncbi:S1C family serine protease [Deinococcus sonorensis]|uniref:Trypsin-like peptidase domain-containing protein n=2 Tax=Deinococcus sonorensis TaxID=309891 RepID=A0AAU7U7H7_9DEIO